MTGEHYVADRRDLADEHAMTGEGGWAHEADEADEAERFGEVDGEVGGEFNEADDAEVTERSGEVGGGIDEAEPDGWAEPAVDAEAGVQSGVQSAVEGSVEGTGHPAVDAAVRAVVNASELPVSEQLAAYEGAHQTLREVLASIED